MTEKKAGQSGDGEEPSKAQVSEEELDEYLSQKGAVELLCEIGSEGSRFNELAEALTISTTTLSKRLDEAREASLITIETTRGERGAAHIYRYTELGVTIQYYMIQSSVMGTYQMLRQAQEDFEEKSESVRYWVVSNSDILLKTPRQLMALVDEYDYEKQEWVMNLNDTDTDSTDTE